ncbi:molecular chaperone TorD family protein [Alcaligenaceae bacterium]|nr:molecular chaperone TorD family protein [Alcaligenaceae bacterium]
MSDSAGSALLQAETINQTWLDYADLFYCMSQAFLPPPSDWTLNQWASPLLEDLREITARIEIDMASFEQAINQEEKRRNEVFSNQDQPDTWLVEYSRLFLVPPVPVTLNAGVYLEGSIGGSSVQMMQACYESVGFVPNDQFHDLLDHVSIQFEFVGKLYEKAAYGSLDADAMATEFTEEFIKNWLSSLEGACQSATKGYPSAAVFLALCRLIDAVIAA